MSVEQQLVRALRTQDAVEPSPDLWSRVLHSIDEDRAHRRRVVTSVGLGAGVLVVLVLLGLFGLVDGPLGRYVRLPVAELIETIALVTIVVVLGPAIRRFGRGYAADLWPKDSAMAPSLLRLLDIAYLLVAAGYILVTVDFDFAVPPERSVCWVDALNCDTVQEQLQDAFVRIGGLLLTLGMLHAVTIAVLPFVALVSNSTRVGRALPRWVVVLLVIAGIAALFVLGNALLGIGAAGTSG